MTTKRVFIFFLLIVLSFVGFAQNELIIKGLIIDNNTGEPLIFVNIGIEGTITGTASNASGKFELRIPEELQQKTLYFSAIGYENRSIAVQQFVAQNMQTVALAPLTYGIEDIEISTSSRVLYRIVRDAARAVNGQFVAQAFQFSVLYSNETYKNNVLQTKRDLVVSVSDTTGYGQKQNAHQAINYQFVNVKRNFEIEGLNDGTTLFDDILSFDIARNPGNVLDTAYLNEYDLELLNESTIDSDSVWVIAYQLSKPQLSRTFDYAATLVKGKLFISKADMAVLKAEAQVKCAQQSPLGRSIAPNPVSALSHVDYNYITSYKKGEKGYLVDHIALSKTYQKTDGSTGRTASSLLVIGQQYNKPVLHSKRQYFEKMISDPDFWEKAKNN